MYMNIYGSLCVSVHMIIDAKQSYIKPLSVSCQYVRVYTFISACEFAVVHEGT